MPHFKYLYLKLPKKLPITDLKEHESLLHERPLALLKLFPKCYCNKVKMQFLLDSSANMKWGINQ